MDFQIYNRVKYLTGESFVLHNLLLLNNFTQVTRQVSLGVSLCIILVHAHITIYRFWNIIQ